MKIYGTPTSPYVRKARAFAAQWLAEPVRRYCEAGHKLSDDIAVQILMDCGVVLTDLGDRWWGGIAVGDLFKTLYILAKDAPKIASWEKAISIHMVCAKRAGTTSSRTRL